jgi:hypothetical protein
MRFATRAVSAAVSLLCFTASSLHGQTPDQTAWLSVLDMHDVMLPYGVMDVYPAGLPLAVESERVPGAVTEQLPLGFLPAHLRRQSSSGTPDPRATTGFTLKSLVASMAPEVRARLRYQSGANRFSSPLVVLIADPRASIRWTPAIPDKAAVGCHACERPSKLAGKTEAQGVY